MRVCKLQLVRIGWIDVDLDDAAILQLAEQEFVRHRLLDVLVDRARERTCAEALVVSTLRQPIGGLIGDLDLNVALGQLTFELDDELLNDVANDFCAASR